jgi:prepilin-type N-terminal cleavage/methylation domain-containing protein
MTHIIHMFHTRSVRRDRRGESGFTLIELMIVILVILILAGILIPQISLAQERAHKATCISNQRNIETAVALWNADNINAIYTGGTMDGSTPNYAALAGTPQYTNANAFKEPDTIYAGNATGLEYYLSMGAAAGNGNPATPSYGHVACAADKLPDPWVAGYDGAAGSVSGIIHTRGSAASP